MAAWKKKLLVLGNDFCLNRDKVRQIVDETEDTYPNKNDKELYQIAYRRIKPLIMAI